MSVYVLGYNLVSDLPVFLDYTLVLCTDLVIDNLEVDLLALQSEAVHYGVVGWNVILLLLFLEGVKMILFESQMVVCQYVLVAAASSDGEAFCVICVKLGDWFSSNVHLV